MYTQTPKSDRWQRVAVARLETSVTSGLTRHQQRQEQRRTAIRRKEPHLPTHLRSAPQTGGTATNLWKEAWRLWEARQAPHGSAQHRLEGTIRPRRFDIHWEGGSGAPSTVGSAAADAPRHGTPVAWQPLVPPGACAKKLRWPMPRTRKTWLLPGYLLAPSSIWCPWAPASSHANHGGASSTLRWRRQRASGRTTSKEGERHGDAACGWWDSAARGKRSSTSPIVLSRERARRCDRGPEEWIVEHRWCSAVQCRARAAPAHRGRAAAGCVVGVVRRNTHRADEPPANTRACGGPKTQDPGPRTPERRLARGRSKIKGNERILSGDRRAHKRQFAARDDRIEFNASEFLDSHNGAAPRPPGRLDSKGVVSASICQSA